VPHERVMRELDVALITDAVARLAVEACCDLGADVLRIFREAAEREESETGSEVFRLLLANASIAGEKRMPLCQDTGLAVVFLDIGQDVHLIGGDLTAAVDEGVRRGYRDGYLRKSCVADPAGARRNTGDNTPAVLHVALVPGEQVRVVVLPKGGGAENKSALAMLTPAQGHQAVVDFVVDTVGRAGPDACPPLIVGVGLGGNFEKVAFLAKRALLRPLGSRNPEPRLAELEDEIEERCNDLGIGPQGLGGRITVMDVFVEEAPAHIASLPVAANIQCHSARHREAVL
jgi:fumarate hydratase subunit alpha